MPTTFAKASRADTSAVRSTTRWRSCSRPARVLHPTRYALNPLLQKDYGADGRA